MDIIGTKGISQLDLPKFKEESQRILKEFDKFISDLDRNSGNQSVVDFRSHLEAHSEDLQEHLKILSTIFHISSLFSSHSNLNETLSLIVQTGRDVFNFK